MRRGWRFLTTRFGLATAACLVLAGWALWSAGILDGPAARQVRSASSWIAPTFGVDPVEAGSIIGNRRMVVIMREDTEERAGDVCDDVRRAADGTVILVLTRSDGEFSSFGCATMYSSDEDIGKAAVVETVMGQGVDEFADRPLEALKIAAVNYDQLVKLDRLPDGARTISPSLPQYLLAVAALVAVVLGAAGTWVAGRRAGRATAIRREERQDRDDLRSRISAGMAEIAQDVIDLDARYAVGAGRTTSTGKLRRADRSFDRDYRRLVVDYTDLMADVTDSDRWGDGDNGAGDMEGRGDETLQRLAARMARLERQTRTLEDPAPAS